ncbi:MAG: CHASE2 domain-containing protein [Pseudomonadales bacterium]|nr:CHASE2 domain-containing protein [Pseudomonadales bacterium]
MAVVRRAGPDRAADLSTRGLTARTLRRFRLELLAVALIVLCVSLVAVQAQWFAVLDRATYDTLLRIRPLPMDDDIVIVGIDSRTLAAVGRWPWSRAQQASLLSAIASAHPRKLFVDIVYAERGDIAGDRLLVAAFDQALPTVLPVVIDAVTPGGTLLEQLPFPDLAETVSALGHVHVSPDADGIVRGSYLFEGIGSPYWPHVGLVLADKAASMAAACTQSQLVTIANDRCDYRRVRFSGPPGTWPHLSALDVLEGLSRPEMLEDRIVLVGRTDLGAPDAIPVPVSADVRPMAGVEYNASLVNAALHGGLVRTVDARLTMVVVLAFVLVALLVVPRLRPRPMLLTSLVLALSTIPLQAALLFGFAWWLDLSAAAVGVALLYPLWSWRRNEMGWRFVGTELDRLAVEAFRWSRNRARVPEEALAERLRWLFEASATDVETEEARKLAAAIRRDQSIVDLPARTVDPFVARLLRIQTLAEEVRVGRDVSLAGIDQMPVGLCVFVASGNIVLSNLAFRRFTGNRRGHSFFIDEALHELAGVEWRELIPRVVRLGGVQMVEVRNPAGARLLVRLAPLEVEGYAQPVCLLTISDVTEIRIAQERREETLAFVSHDLRSPINSILSLVRNPKLANEPDLLRRIEAYAQRSLQVSEQFVQLSRLENLSELVRHEIDLVSVAENGIDQTFEIAQARRISIRLEAEADVGQGLWMLANGELLERVITNLLENAVKYSPPDRVVIVRISREGASALLRVQDQGYGIPEGEVARIFDPYFRSQAPELAAADGVGLGLRFVRLAVELHGGSIEVVSVFGQGSEFRILLPADVEIPAPGPR